MIIKRNRVKCLLCGDIIESKSDHNLVSCSCGKLAVDGGLTHLSRTCRSRENFKEMSETRQEKKDTQPKSDRTKSIESIITGYRHKYADPAAKPDPGASTIEREVYLELKRQRLVD